MDDAMLAALEHENMIVALSLGGSQVPGAWIERRDGLAIIATGLPLRLFNKVLIEDADASPEDLATAIAAMRAREARFVVDLRAGPDDRFRPLLRELGLVRSSEEAWMPGMAMHPVSHPGTTRAAGSDLTGFEIRRITGPSGLADHVRAAAAGFGVPEDWLAAVMTDGLLQTPFVTVYVGEVDGEPVSTGLAIRTGRTIGVYNVATIEPARRRGYGAAMTMRIVADGAAAGCDVAVLQSSEMGLSVYERLGFRTVVAYTGYVDPRSLDGPAPDRPV